MSAPGNADSRASAADTPADVRISANDLSSETWPARALRKPGRLVLADGSVFEGFSLGATATATGEAVFTTGMTGYQEVLTDPSYHSQVLVMTAAHIGNTGINTEDAESRGPQASAFIIGGTTLAPSNWRSLETLDAYLERHNVVGLAGVDTRRLTRHIRDHGAQTAAVGTASVEELVARAQSAPSMAGLELASRVTTAEAYEWRKGSPDSSALEHIYWYRRAKASAERLRVVAFDFGIKRHILRRLVDFGCDVHVVPAHTPAETVRALNPNGIFLSNGPGDPAATTIPTATVKELLGFRPIFGICLGHQLVARALEVPTYKLKFGHRGLNQPVRDEITGRIEITSQNHGFAVNHEALPSGVVRTHTHLNDGTCEGLECAELSAFSVQYHPEAAAGPHDSTYLFERFVDRMRTFNASKK